MKQIIIGYGNTLRGEDGFGVDVIKHLHQHKPHNATLKSMLQLTPELILELLEYDAVIFIDAAYSPTDTYALACSFQTARSPTFSHHISAFAIIKSLELLYAHTPDFQIFSMLCNNFEAISNQKAYLQAIEQTAGFYSKTP